jgi:hypothetical protein
MPSVSFFKSNEFFDTFFTSISRSVKQRDSLKILSSSLETSDFLLKLLFNDYNLRNKYFGRQKDDYVFITLNLDTETDIQALDQKLIQFFNEEFEYFFTSLQEIGIYLQTHNLTAVLIVTGENQVLFRYGLSYNFLFDGRLVVLDITDFKHDYFNKVLDARIPESDLRKLVEFRLKELGHQASSDEILNEIKGDITKLDKAIVESAQKSMPLVSQRKAEDIVEQQKPEIVLPLQVESTPKPVATPKSPVLVKPAVTPSPKPVAAPKPQAPLQSGMPQLTAREQGVFDLLEANKFVSRSEIARSVWGESGASASDDAIDQVISRLRRKFVQAGYPKSYITSKKGEGIVFGDF